MNREELTKLYKSKIIPENASAYHFEKRESCDQEILAYNAICGDKYSLYLDIENNTIKKAYFHGMGCALSKASTSILLKRIEGMTVEEVIAFTQKLENSIKSGVEEDFRDEQLNILLELKNFEGRNDCITLSWKSLRESIELS